MKWSPSLLARQLFIAFFFLTAAACHGAGNEKSKFSDKPNKDLKQSALRLAKEMREMLQFYQRKDRELRSEYDRRSGNPSDPREKESRQRWIEETDGLHDATMQRYKDQYWSDAILLADEIYRRLPKKAQRPNIVPIYQQPTNVMGVRVIADDLERIAKSLPD